MKKVGLLIIILILSARIIQTVSAAPYHPPPPPPPPPAEKPKDEPIPPPEPPEPDIRPPDNQPTEPPPPPPTPTPTPCIPNFCFFQQTTCCFDSLCVFHGETEKSGNSRCLKLAPKGNNTNPFSQFTQSTKSFFGLIISGISSIFGK